MHKLTEQELLASFVGRSVNRNIFAELARESRNEYVIYNSRYLDKPQHRDLFGVTDKLQERWEYSGVDFNLHLTLDGDVIVKGHLDKYREGCGGNGRPVVHVLKETQQELRVARRILEYITK